MNQEEDNWAKKPELQKEGDDTMSAVAQNYVYKVIVKDEKKQVPTMSKEKYEAMKAAVEKYQPKK